MRRALSLRIALGVLVAVAPSAFGQTIEPRPIVGIDPAGVVHNVPKDWPAAAGVWNGKAARYNPLTDKLVFETFRKDILGGSVIPEPGRIKATGVTRFFLAGPRTGIEDQFGTTVLYISDKNGRNAQGIGCEDMEDAKNGVAIYLVQPQATDQPNVPVRQKGGIVYANQNKDLGTWHPNGQWIFAAVEMPHHAVGHNLGNGELGMFNNLWAISVDGKKWVQLTRYETNWEYYDPVAMMPYAALDAKNYPIGLQYSGPGNQHPYSAYSASAKNQPPPASGIMRPTVGNNEREGKTPIVWTERVGLAPKYTWGGPLQLARADIVFNNGLPALVNYQRNLTPTPPHPEGKDLWANPGGEAVIGAGYESWAFSRDDEEILFASDACLPFSSRSGKRTISPWSQAFSDVVSWRWRRNPSLWNVTDYHPQRYAYHDNGGPPDTLHYGHWEEPAVYLLSENKADTIAFSSSANLIPPWNPMNHLSTFGLDVWLVKRNGKTPAKRLTFFNGDNGPRWLAYPTATDPLDDSLFLTVVPGGKGGENPPGTIYTLAVRGD